MSYYGQVEVVTITERVKEMAGIELRLSILMKARVQVLAYLYLLLF